jgi:general secretion pathway protein L
MPSVSPFVPARKFFGIDLGLLANDLRTAWRGMGDWFVVAWLRPNVPVRLWLPSGGHGLCSDIRADWVASDASATATKFDAILLPEEVLLRRDFELPQLSTEDLQAAIALEVQSFSPFEAADTVWAQSIEFRAPKSARVHVVLTSRKIVSGQIKSISAPLADKNPEIWVKAFETPGCLMLPGYGGGMRERYRAFWQKVNVLLCFMLFTLIGGLAITPSVQLYLRVLQANHEMVRLQKVVAPVLVKRESLLRVTEQLDALVKIAGQPVPALQTLDLITRSLPDDTSLLSFRAGGLKVSVSGQTSNAAALMKQLGATPGLKDVRAPSPAIRPLGAARESFTIEFMLNPEQMGLRP